MQFDLREWLPDDTFSWRSLEGVRAAADDFDAHGGEWPEGEPRAWEPLSHLRERCTAALGAALSELPGHQVVIAVCHGMVIWSLTGVRHTDPGQWRRIDWPSGAGAQKLGDPLP